jgi:hypothetical protein
VRGRLAGEFGLGVVVDVRGRRVGQGMAGAVRAAAAGGEGRSSRHDGDEGRGEDQRDDDCCVGWPAQSGCG